MRIRNDVLRPVRRWNTLSALRELQRLLIQALRYRLMNQSTPDWRGVGIGANDSEGVDPPSEFVSEYLHLETFWFAGRTRAKRVT